jgi:hypothetical protein
MTASQEVVSTEDESTEKIAEALELAWDYVFKIVNIFISQHDKFGFSLIERKSNPRIEDMLLSLKVMNAILNIIDDSESIDTGSQRMLLNAKQQIILFERASLAIQGGDEDGYLEAVRGLRSQAQF